MPRAVVILPTTTYRAADFVEAAEALGVDLVVASEEPSVLEMGDSFVHINCSDPGLAAKEVVAIGDDVPLDAIVAADDAGVVIAADASQQLGLLGNTPSAAESTRNKHLMRQALASAEIAQPDFELHNDLAPTRLAYPLVAKPLDRSASQGVIRVDEPEALDATVSRIRSIVDDPDAQVLLESFVGGREVAVEGLLRHGELLMLALFDKPDTPDGPVFPETIFVTPSRLPEELQRECIRVAQSACSALELTHGPVHIELKIDERETIVAVCALPLAAW